MLFFLVKFSHLHDFISIFVFILFPSELFEDVITKPLCLTATGVKGASCAYVDEILQVRTRVVLILGVKGELECLECIREPART